MIPKLNRRDFLKLAGLLPLGLTVPRFLQPNSERKNVLIVVLDAFSAYNASLYGYPRETTPNIARLAQRGVVYNRHYAGSNYTTPGTATLLTGTYPWTHRAFQYNTGVADPVVARHIFNVFPGYHRTAYTHNILANTLLKQFKAAIEDLIPRGKLLLGSYGKFIQTLLSNDEDLASVGWRRSMIMEETGYAYSLLLSHFYQPLQERAFEDLSARFPRGIPTANFDDRFVLEDAIDYLGDYLLNAPQPFLGYFHFLPPHARYRTTREFFGRFKDDGYRPPEKPLSIFKQKKKGWTQADSLQERTEYDEFILYADKEFGKLYDRLEAAGILENTVLVLTSDHGEMNERGIREHSTSSLFEPLIRIPLVIFDPGRKERLDVNVPTSASDVLPTLLRLTGQALPDWSEGIALPPFNSTAVDEERSVYVLHATKNDPAKPLTDLISVALIKGRYKLHYYLGHPEVKNEGVNELIYLYDIEADPEELVDLAQTRKDVADVMLAEIKAKLAEVNQPYL